MLNKMKLSTKLVGGFIIVAVITLIIGIFGWTGANTLSSNLNEIGEVRLRSIDALISLSKAQGDIIIGERAIVNPLVSDKELRKAQYEYIDNAWKKADEQWNKYEQLTKNEKEETLWKKFKSEWNEWKSYHQKIINLAKEKDKLMDIGVEINDDRIIQLDKKAFNQADEARNYLLPTVGTISELIAYNEELAREELKEGEQASALVTGVTMAGMIIGVIVALILGILLSISITKPMFTAVENLKTGATQVAAASIQLSATSQQLAEGNAEQASSIEETSSTIEETSSMVQQNTENTKQAAILVGQAKAASDKANAEMQEMMTAMSELKKSSDQIAKIIKVIDDIAFQTNILALNAAVEAARAGDAGMGFAVVSEEVRNLAQRSAQAAKDTAAMIEGNIELSEEGVNVAGKVKESLEEITVQAKKVNELMDEIAAASQEQAQGAAQINKAIIQMEKVTQQNAAGAEESAAASEELSSQAENMKEIVNQLIRLVNGASETEALAGNLNIRSYNNNSRGVYEGKKRNTSSLAIKKEGKKTHIVNPEEIIPLNDDIHDF